MMEFLVGAAMERAGFIHRERVIVQLKETENTFTRFGKKASAYNPLTPDCWGIQRRHGSYLNVPVEKCVFGYRN